MSKGKLAKLPKLLLQVHLTFTGNCKTAFEFYQQCIGGELELHTLAQQADAKLLPDSAKELVLQASLHHKNWSLHGSDLVSEKGRIIGNAVTIVLISETEKEARNYYSKLVRHGVATHPLKRNKAGVLYGDLTDGFHNNWIITNQLNH